MSVHIIRKTDSPRTLERQLRVVQRALPRMDARLHSGRLKLSEPPDRYQERAREEWSERPR